jgi:hypothetical protein
MKTSHLIKLATERVTRSRGTMIADAPASALSRGGRGSDYGISEEGPEVLYGFDRLSLISDIGRTRTCEVGRLYRLTSAPGGRHGIAEGELIDQAGAPVATGEICWALAGSAYPYLFAGRLLPGATERTPGLRQFQFRSNPDAHRQPNARFGR